MSAVPNDITSAAAVPRRTALVAPLSVRPQLSLRTAVVVGTGLIGTSVALALTACGVRVHLEDRDPGAAARAQSVGAGTLEPPAVPADLAVVAVPPDAVGTVVRDCRRRALAVHTLDLADVKAVPLADLTALGCDTTHHIGGHPTTAREVSGPSAARADLFRDRPWVLTPLARTRTDTLNAALDVVTACGATPVVMEPHDHDRAVALVSHAPHLLSSLLAGRLAQAPPGALRLAGPGVHDMTRAAAGDPELWAGILATNAGAVADVLGELADDLGRTVAALRALAAGGTAPDERRLTEVLGHGRTGRIRLDENHGGSVAREPRPAAHDLRPDAPRGHAARPGPALRAG